VTGCGFSYGHYREVLGAARERYAFAAFDDPPADGRPFVLLRHDVDFSLEPALRMARIESELGARSTYLVLPHAHYNLLGDPGFAQLREILGLGHRLGLHYDLAFYAANGLPPAETLRREAAMLEDRFGVRVSVVAEHNPGRVPRPASLDLGGLEDAYSAAFTGRAEYLSDSCQFWREGCVCGFLDPSRHPRLQVLVHPVWWSEEGRLADEALRAETGSRVAAALEAERRVLDHYASLEHLGNRRLFRREGG
jgi:hypothetical protein